MVEDERRHNFTASKQAEYSNAGCVLLMLLLSLPLQSVAELEMARGELHSQAVAAVGEVSRLSVAVQDLEQQRAGLARKLNV